MVGLPWIALVFLYVCWIVYARRPRVWIWMGDRPPKTGGERYCEEIYQEFRQAGVPVVAINIDLLGGMLLIRHLPVVGRLLESLTIALLAGWCRGPFMVDEHFATLMLASNWIRKMRGESLVLLVHHMERQREHGPLINRWRLQLAQKVVVVSDYSCQQVLGQGVPLTRIVKVPPGCEPPPRPHRTSPPPWKLLCVAPAQPRKGLDVVLKALGGLPPHWFELEVIGHHQTRYYRQVLKPLSGPGVTFLGRVSRQRLDQAYSQAHLFLFASRQEGFGISLVEAMQAGVVPIVAQSSALPELVEHGRSGYLFPAEDSEALQRQILALFQAPEEWLRVSRQLSQEMPGKFSWARCRREFLEATREYWLPLGTG